MRPPLQHVHPPGGALFTVPGQWVSLRDQDIWPPTRRGTPTVHGRWEALHGGQGSISLEYQTCTSPYPFDTLVTGMHHPAKGSVCVVYTCSTLKKETLLPFLWQNLFRMSKMSAAQIKRYGVAHCQRSWWSGHEKMRIQLKSWMHGLQLIEKLIRYCPRGWKANGADSALYYTIIVCSWYPWPGALVHL